MRPITPLGPGDEDEIERCLVAHADSSMFLRQNLRLGLVDRGEPLQGVWAAVRDHGGVIVAVASHNNRGNVILQGQVDAVAGAAHAVVARSGRAVRGLFGPRAHVVAARAALGLADRPTRLDSHEDLLTLALADLRVPPPLADGRWICRHPLASDREALVRWDFAYAVEALGARPPSPEEEQRALASFVPSPTAWVLAVDGAPVARSGFNARLPDAVQIGGVYTPPALRNRGYARGVVAGSLVAARAQGAARAILFTENPAARAAYVALGFRVVGDYGLVVFAD